MDSPKLLLSSMKYSNTVLRLLSRKRTVAFNVLSPKYSTENAQSQELVIKEKIQLTKPSVTKWKRPPFLKNFFCAKFDVELLAFPEILNKEEVFELEDTVKGINNLMKQRASVSDIAKPGEAFDDEFITELKQLGLFGRLMPEKYGGLNLTHTANTRINEALGLDWSLCSMLAAHENFTSEVILRFGSDSQKSYYLPKLANGDIIGAYCCSELESGSDLLSMTSLAQKDISGNFVLNGVKSWVTNADIAGVFVVFAKTENPMDPKQQDISAFLIDRHVKGIKVVPQSKLCLHGVNTGLVHFENVVIPSFNMIGNVNQGFEVYLKASESFRIAMSSFTFGALKAILDSLTERVIRNDRVGICLGDHQLMRTRLSRIAVMIYAMESVSYFTSAILDSTENPDITFESAALKLFNSKGTLYCIRELMEAMGSSSLILGSELERFHRDALALAMFDAPNDVVQLYLGLSGCKFVGESAKEKILQLRNRPYFVREIMKDNIRRWKISHNWIKFEHDIAGHVHPSLVEWGNKLETCILKLEVAVHSVLEDHGNLVSETQIMPQKLADVASDLYAWSAVLSRSSRSYCIGLRNSQHEMRLAHAFCHDCHLRVTNTLDDIFKGVNLNNDRNHLLTGDEIMDCRGYFPEHPLKHNF